jgi:hypothetical protein
MFKITIERETLEQFRDDVLQQRGPLAENGMTSDQINDVLGLFDDAFEAALAAQPAPAAVPPGYALVPIEPTPGMIDAARQSGAEGTREELANDYRAMIAASHLANRKQQLRQRLRTAETISTIAG